MTVQPPESNPAKRKRLLTILALIFLLVGVVWGVRWFLHSRGHETTDDAYVAGNLVRVTPRIDGSVVAVLADDTDFVKQGQIVVKLDDTDARWPSPRPKRISAKSCAASARPSKPIPSSLPTWP